MCPPVLAPIWKGIIIGGVTRDESLSEKTFMKNITKSPSSPKCSRSNSLLWESIADDSIDINLHVQLNNSIIDAHHITS